MELTGEAKYFKMRIHRVKTFQTQFKAPCEPIPTAKTNLSSA